MYRFIRKVKAFTLIEMAVVITIISVIMGMVLATGKSIKLTNLDAVIANVKKYSDAVDQFDKQYNGLPGDIGNIAILPSVSPAPVAGNGNGVIDNTTEALNFWYELAITNIVTGNFNNTVSSYQYIPANDMTVGGFPSGPITGSGFTVSSSANYELVFTFSGFPASNYVTAILSPADAYYIDKKIDDGFPTTGIVQSFDGTGQSGNCVSGGKYNQSYSGVSCYMQFIVNKHPVANLAPGLTTCDGSTIGTNRISGLSTGQPSPVACPFGFYGYVIEACTSSGWKAIRNLCETVKCTGGLSQNEAVNIQCPPGMIGYVQYFCGASGVLELNSNTCNISSVSPSNATYCVNTNIYGVGNNHRTLACPIGYTGTRVQECISNSWTNDINTCVSISNSGSSIGDYQNTAVSPCSIGGGNYYNASSTYSNGGIDTCIMPLFGSTCNWRLTHNFCVPNYGSGCSSGTQRDASCPLGQTGHLIQQCNSSGYWENLTNTCVPVTCGGEPIGSFRVMANQICPAGYVGTMLEVCDYTDFVNYRAAAWQSSTAACSPIICPATSITNDVTVASWSQTNANTNASATCSASYPYQNGVLGAAVTTCGIDGNWYASDNGCSQYSGSAMLVSSSTCGGTISSNYTIPIGVNIAQIRVVGPQSSEANCNCTNSDRSGYAYLLMPVTPGSVYSYTVGGQGTTTNSSLSGPGLTSAMVGGASGNGGQASSPLCSASGGSDVSLYDNAGQLIAICFSKYVCTSFITIAKM